MSKEKTSVFIRTFNSLTALIIFILIVSIAILLGYVIGINQNIYTPPARSQAAHLTSAKDPTADWQTYNNDNFGFSLKYPTDWTLNDTLQSSDEGNDDQALTLTRSIDDTKITLNINNLTPSTTASPDIHAINYENDKLIISKDSDKQEINQDNPVISQYSGQINGNRYLFTTSSITEPAALKLIEQIISTLKVNG